MKTLTLLLALALQQPATVRINYVNADLGDVIRSLAAVLGVNVVLTDVPSRRITFQTPQPVPAPQAGAVLEAILESQGLVMVQSGPVAQVMPEEKRPSTGPVRVGKEFPTPPPLGLVTQIVPLDYIRAEEGVTLLKQVASKTARVEVVPRSNAVLITDRGVHIARYLDLLRQLDIKTGGEAGLRTYVYPLKHASAAELATTLGQVFGTTVAAAPERQRVRALEGRSLSSELTGFRRRELQSLQERAQMALPTVAAPGPVSSRAAAESTLAPGQGLVGRTTIVPDQATNALVIRTAPPNFSVLQETIEQLDVRPPQVLLEVLIAEVTLDRASQYGINWQLFTQRGVRGDSTRGIGVGVGPQSFGDTLLKAFQGLGVRVVSLASLNVRAILEALASRTNVRVLSTPRVLALNNEEARILVGSEVPFVSSTFSGLTAGLNTVVQFRNVGTQLTVIPTVNNDGYVTFRVLQEVTRMPTGSAAAPPPSPTPEPPPPTRSRDLAETPPPDAATAPRAAADLRAAAAGPLAQRLSPKYLEEHCLLPLAVGDAGELLVAAGDPLDPTVVDELCWTYGRRVKLVDAPAAEIHAAILSAQSAATPEVQATDLRVADLVVLAEEEETLDDLRALASQAPVIKLVNVMILEALRARSSDIHLESTPDGLRVRYRIDGVLHELSHPPRQFQAAVLSRIKIMAGMNIAERRLAQDGRIRLRLSDRELDLRVSTTPTLHGEGVVLRILDRGVGVRSLADLGMPPLVRDRFERLIRQPHGIILVTGPTGSGKTTTLYAALDRLNDPGVKIVTVEDPVEYLIAGVTQIPVNPKIGLTFAAALRSILRHDPDIIMV